MSASTIMRAALALAFVGVVHGAADTGASSATACKGACTGIGAAKVCVFTAKMDLHASSTGYYTFDECGNTPMPVIEMEQGVEYRFIQNDKTNWFHPLGFAYFADGAHKDVDELEPGISQSAGDTCKAGNTCQAPRYFKNNVFLGKNFDNVAKVGGEDFGLDVFEPQFQTSYGDWQTAMAVGTGYEVRLTLTDTTYAKDIFYFCHVHNAMSGRVKVVKAGTAGGVANHISAKDEPALGYTYEAPSAFDKGCGTYGTDKFNRDSKTCAAGNAFFCADTTKTTSAAQKVFGECLYATDCHMAHGMHVKLDKATPAATFMHQMIPHHANAVNMAKTLMKAGYTDNADAEVEDLLMSIINKQNKQINIMTAWLETEKKETVAKSYCDAKHNHMVPPSKRRLQDKSGEQNFVTLERRLQAQNSIAATIDQPRRRLLDTGASSATACKGACTGIGAAKVCVFTAKMDLHASSTGYYTFDECGNTPMPVIEMEQGVEYRFIQNDKTNWFHPLGFAYFADGAHKDVDELEPGISQSAGDTCKAGNTCQAPRYFKNNVFLGKNFDNVAKVGGEDFGLDVFEPQFQTSYGDWQTAMAVGTGYEVRLTLTDTTYAKDIFYFCHVHNAMSGRVKVVKAGTAGGVANHISAKDEPALGYTYEAPSAFDKGCGTYGTDKFNRDSKTCETGDAFFCIETGTSAAMQSFGNCLYAMDCHMNHQMRVNLHWDTPTVTFMHQMIPHHTNAVNMAKALMKAGYTDNADAEVEDLVMDIINVQNKQINVMTAWLAAGKHAVQPVCEYGKPAEKTAAAVSAAPTSIIALCVTAVAAAVSMM